MRGFFKMSQKLVRTHLRTDLAMYVVVWHLYRSPKTVHLVFPLGVQIWVKNTMCNFSLQKWLANIISELVVHFQRFSTRLAIFNLTKKMTFSEKQHIFNENFLKTSTSRISKSVIHILIFENALGTCYSHVWQCLSNTGWFSVYFVVTINGTLWNIAYLTVFGVNLVDCQLPEAILKTPTAA